jgi:predicted DNA-binding transcriptional regulator AlpA
MDNSNQYVRVKDIATRLGIADSTVYAWVASGKLPKAHAKLSPKCTVWRADEVNAAIELLMTNQDPSYDKNNFDKSAAEAKDVEED